MWQVPFTRLFLGKYAIAEVKRRPFRRVIVVLGESSALSGVCVCVMDGYDE